MKDLSEYDDVLTSVNPFDRFAESYLAHPDNAMKTIKKLRAQRLKMMTDIEETPKRGGAKKAVAGSKTPGVKKTRAKKEPTLAELKKVLGKISAKQLEQLKSLVKG